MLEIYNFESVVILKLHKFEDKALNLLRLFVDTQQPVCRVIVIYWSYCRSYYLYESNTRCVKTLGRKNVNVVDVSTNRENVPILIGF